MTTVNTYKLNGIEAVPVTVECEISTGIGIHLVGLADYAVKESLLRTITAMSALGYRIPGKKIVINLAPADLHKSGCGYDLPIALALIAESGQAALNLDGFVIAGELGLDGSVREVRGWMQAAELAASVGKACILPERGARLAARALGDGAKVYGVGNMTEAIQILTGEPAEPADGCGIEEPEEGSWWNAIRGHESEKRAIEIAVAGGHPMLMVGGKPYLAKAAMEIMPPVSAKEAAEVQRLCSVSGRELDPHRRPFRAPHYSSSLSALIGGGAGDNILPGEVSLAHNGILYLDELDWAPKAAQECLRLALEDRKVTISRLKNKVDYPADFLLFASVSDKEDIAKIAGPIYDRLTVQCCLHPEFNGGGSTEQAAVVAERVAAARARQLARQGKLNDELRLGEIEDLSEECKQLADRLMEQLELSALAYSRILKIARTIADLEGAGEIAPVHLAEAAAYRFLDRRAI